MFRKFKEYTIDLIIEQIEKIFQDGPKLTIKNFEGCSPISEENSLLISNLLQKAEEHILREIEMIMIQVYIEQFDKSYVPKYDINIFSKQVSIILYINLQL